MKIVTTEMEHGEYLLTLENSNSDKKSFTIQKIGGEIVISNTYQDEVCIEELIDCLIEVKDFFTKYDN